MGVNFFLAKLDTKGGGGPGASCLRTQKLPILIFEYFPSYSKTANGRLVLKSYLMPGCHSH